MVPKDLKFTKSHEWARLDAAAGVVTIGITEFAVQQLGDIVFIELPAVGKAVQKEASFGVIESVKAAVELYSPVSGTVTEANKSITENFDVLGQDPYGAGWMIKIKAADAKELASLLTAAEYEAFLQSPENKH
jgi:glycine cleavage system H protein